MPSMSRDSSGAPVVDLENGSATEEELAEVNPRMAMCIKISLDVIVAVYTLFLIGLTVWLAKVSDNWWDPWPAVLIFAAILVWTFWMSHKIKDVFTRNYATKHTMPSDDNDLSTNLLTSSKN